MLQSDWLLTPNIKRFVLLLQHPNCPIWRLWDRKQNKCNVNRIYYLRQLYALFASPEPIPYPHPKLCITIVLISFGTTVITSMNWKQSNPVPRSLIDEAEDEIGYSNKIQFFWLARLWANDVNVQSPLHAMACAIHSFQSLQFCSNKYFK